MTGTTALAVLGSFFWGVVSVLFSPCHLASIPLMVAYVAGQEKAVNPRQAVGYSAAFTIGLFITIAADRGDLRAAGTHAGGRGQLLADPGGGRPDLGGPGDAGRRVVHPVEFDAGAVQHEGASGGLRPGSLLRHPVGVLHLRVHRTHPGHHHGPGGDRHRDRS